MKINRYWKYIIIPAVCMITACSNHEISDKITGISDSTTLFTLLPADSTGVQFTNNVVEGLNTNVLLYEYFYNGGGVAIGDVNNDGLQDIYFSSNLGNNQLYLNKGEMNFEDVTVAANVVVRPGPWKTGVTMADVNGDGKLDIYVCYSGKLPPAKRANQLFINSGNGANGIPEFSEQAMQYGLADSGFSTQGYFFDYDRDGDLDMFLLSHNPDNLPVLDEPNTIAILKNTDVNIGVKLFKNTNNHFADITKSTGISSSSLTYGLGAGIADVDGDGWQDVYISNDYGVPDYLYINNHDGTFTNKLKTSMGHISHFSMGNNIADINNDGQPDIFTLDMLPADNKRQKLLFAPDNYEQFELSLRSGFYYQYMRNMLQLNNGNGTFSEIGQLSGISNTDWSWAPLFADYDNDGWKDLFITNGYLRDYTNMDFMKYMNDYIQSKGRLKKEDVLDIIRKMPSSNMENYLYKNNSDLVFSDVSKQWGVNIPSSSNGAAYADLDNDGDLDLIVNNINQPAFIYRNEENRAHDKHYLALNLRGEGKNTQGIGARVFVFSKGKQQYLEQMPSRGFQSNVTPVLHFGLGTDSIIDSLKLLWLSGKEQVLKNVTADQVITLTEADAGYRFPGVKARTPAFIETKSPIAYHNATNNINDFKRQPLMVNPLSFSGPCLVKGDVNADGLEDIYAGGGSGEPGVLYIQQKNGQFVKKIEPAFDTDKSSEDADALFTDINKDGFLDLYVASGGYHNYTPGDVLLQDRLYVNDGKGNFTKAVNALPEMRGSKGCIRAADANGDGFIDFFVGGRSIPGRYPETPESYMLINDGKGHFTDKTSMIAPQLKKAGMITDAGWLDLNGDKKPDLVVVGEWMPVTAFINENGTFKNKTSDYFDKEYSGWWNKMLVTDLNGDGKADLVIGNMGLNSQCKASDKEPAELYYKDFDNNGSVDPIFCFYMGHKTYPYVSRDELLDQMSIMRTRFPDYKTYADATMADIFPTEEMKDVKHLVANELGTSYFESGPGGKFFKKKLPLQVQFSPVFTISQLDYDKDGKPDLLLCGNVNHARLRFGKCDANFGVLLKGDGKGNFNYVDQVQSGFNIWGDVRSVLDINNLLLFGINQGDIKTYKLR